jgi:hypothetical protein
LPSLDDQSLASHEKATLLVRAERLHLHFSVPAHPDHLGKTTRVILIGLHRAN